MRVDDSIVCFGEWKYEISTGIIRKIEVDDSGLLSEFHLSQSMQLILLHFIKNSGRLIFKEELVNLLRGHSENRGGQVLRVIYSLRKILGDNGNNPKYIVTIRKRGFRFVSSVFYLNKLDVHTSDKLTTFKESRVFLKNSIVFCSLLIILLLAAVICFLTYRSYEENLSSKVLSSVSLSSISGAEFELSISPDGKFVVYNHSANLQDNYKIIVQNIQTKEKWIIKHDDNHSLHGPVWVPEGNGIIYQRLQQNEKCEIRKLSFNPSNFKEVSDEILTICGVASFASKIQITPSQKFIFFSSRDNPLGQISIVRHSLESNTNQKLTAPPASGIGDYGISMSPNGEMLAFLRAATQTHAQLWIMDLNDGTLEMLHESGDFFPTAITWSNDGENILFSGDVNAIYSFNFRTKKTESIINTDYPALHIEQTIKGDFIFSGGNFWDSTVSKMGYSEAESLWKPIKTIEVGSSERIIQVSPASDGAIAVLSERSGKLALWFYYPDGKKIEIIGLNVKNEYAKGAFSSDGKRFLLQSGDQIWIIDGTRYKPIPIPNHEISAQFSWSADSRKIFYTASTYGNLQVYSLDLLSGSIELVDHNLALYAESPNGQYTIKLRHLQKNLEITTSSGESHFLPILGEFDIFKRRIVLRNDAIYFIHREHLRADYEVMKYNIRDRSVESTGIKRKLHGRIFDVSYDEDFIFTDDGKKGEIDIRFLAIGVEK